MAAALAFGGQPDTAIEAVDRSIRMSPRDPFNYTYLHFAGVAYFAAERYAKGVTAEEQALLVRPNVSPALRVLAACHVGLGQMDQAKGAVAEVLRLVPESSIKRDVYGQVAYARESDRERYAAALRKAGLPAPRAASSLGASGPAPIKSGMRKGSSARSGITRARNAWAMSSAPNHNSRRCSA
jgi:tetratricopeptide (TPR) repeat protein